MPSFSQWSVRTFLLWLVLACLLPGVGGAILLFIYQYQEGRIQQEKNMILTARALVQVVDNQLSKSQAVAQALSNRDSLLARDFSRFHAGAREVLARAQMEANVVLRDETGQQVINTAVAFGTPLPMRPLPEHVRQVFLTGKPTISDVFLGFPLQRPIMSVNVPVFIDGKVAYVLGVGVLPQQLSAILKAQNLPPGWIAAVLDSTGTIVGRNITPEKFVGNKATPGLRAALMHSSEGILEATSQEGTPVLTAYSRSAVTRWGVALGIPRHSLQRAMMQSLYRLAAGVAVLFLIGLVLAWFMGGGIARSVRALTVPATALGSGERVQVPHVPVQEVAEVGVALAHAAELLQQRAAAIQARETELAQAHALLRDVIDSSPALIYLKDLNGHFLLVNKTYEKLIDAKSSQSSVSPFSSRRALPVLEPSDADLKVLQSGEIVQFEETIDTAEGVKYFAVSKAPLRSHDRQVIGICAVAVDVTLLKKAEAHIRDLVATLENRVEQRTEELRLANVQLLEVNEQLQEANRQLEAFSYSVAHDLRAPLRSIQGFADALIEDYEGTLDATGDDYLKRISKAAARMEQLIDDLLAYSRLARMELPLGRVNLDEVFRQVMANLSAQIQESQANIVIAQHLPSVCANKTACLQVFQNLISNAIKFSKPNSQACIRIWSERRKNEHNETECVRIWIADNGIGIPAAHQQRIFKPFERLHGASEYAGSGIGLAIVDKAARRMHGHCGVESEVQVGSRFWVELPAVTVEE